LKRRYNNAPPDIIGHTAENERIISSKTKNNLREYDSTTLYVNTRNSTRTTEECAFFDTTRGSKQSIRAMDECGVPIHF